MKRTGLLIMSLVLSACSASEDTSTARVDVPVQLLASRDARERGRILFENKCALCHGVRADGRGVRHTGLSGKPANFRSRNWRATVDAAGVYTTISEGKRGTSMPAWPTLSEDEKWSLVAFVLSASERSP